MKLTSFISIRKKLYLSYLLSNRQCEIPHRINETPYIFIFLACGCANLGDVAITYSQHLMLQKKFPNYAIIEIPIYDTLYYIPNIKKIIRPEDIITITGGGNMGDMYDDIEYLRQIVIQSFPKNRIISFPQSIHFSKNSFGRKRLTIASKIYNKHPNLTIMARDINSYNMMSHCFYSCEIHLTPDIVMTLDKRKNYNRNGLLLCLRNDPEQFRTSNINATINSLKQDFNQIKYTDTTLPYYVTIENKEYYLSQIWDEFSQASLVITDRLHGMIFSYITKTPTLVIDNSTKKVLTCFDWIKDCGYINPLNSSTLTNQFILHDNFENTHNIICSKFDFINNKI